MGEVTNFKRAYYGSFIIYVLLIVVLFKYLILPNVSRYKSMQVLSSPEASGQDILNTIDLKKNELNQLDQLLFKFDSGQNAFGLITNFCEQNELSIEYREPELDSKGNYSISSNEIVVAGNFKSMVLLIYEIERKLGWVNSCTFTKEDMSNGRTSKEILKCQIKFKNTVQNERGE